MSYELEFLPSALKERQKLDKKFKIFAIQNLQLRRKSKKFKKLFPINFLS